ncbi:unnamed protein product [Caenorhabditis brenneri]
MPTNYLAVHLATSATIRAKRDYMGIKPKDLEELWNGFRSSYAKEEQIGNMHEIKVDSQLEKVANSMAEKCTFPTGDYVIVYDQNTKSKGGTLYDPLQTKFACVDLVQKCENRGIEKGFCLFGPQSSFSEELKKKNIKTGPIGSHCVDGTADNGLCKAPVGSSSATTPMNSILLALVFLFVSDLSIRTLQPPIHTMINFHYALLLILCVHLVTSAKDGDKPINKKSLNEILGKGFNDARVDFAKKHGIGNMQELKFDAELEKLVKSMAQDCKFKDGPYVINHEMNKEENAATAVDPLQTKFGCARAIKDCPNGVKNGSPICLFGPQSSAGPELGLTNAKFGELGSHCDHGTVDNGLCKAGGGSISKSAVILLTLVLLFVGTFQ